MEDGSGDISLRSRGMWSFKIGENTCWNLGLTPKRKEMEYINITNK